MHHFGGRRGGQLRLELGVDKYHQGDNLLKLKLSFAISALALTPLAAPLLAPRHPLIALVIRSFFSRLCHQDPGRSFMVDGSPIAVCVRCLGIYCGPALAALLDVGKVPARRLLAIALLLNLLDVATASLHWHGNLPLLRFLLGLVLGVGVGAVLLSPMGRSWRRLSPGDVSG
jgi:uncharacterized membrane protein